MSEEPSAGRDGRESDGESVGAAYRKAGPFLAASWQLTGAVAVWTFAGWGADKLFNTKPWLLVAGAVLGLALGFYLFFKALMSIGKETGGK